MRRLAYVVVGILVSACLRAQAITMETSSSAHRENRPSGIETAECSLTISGANSNRYLLVGLVVRNTDGTGTTSPTTVKWRGTTALTQLGAVSVTDNASAYIYGLVAPVAATDQVYVNVTDGENADYITLCSNWYNVNQSTSVGSFNSATGNSTAPSVNITSATGEVVVDTVAANSGTATINCSQSAVANQIGGPRGASSSKAGGASVTMCYTLGTSGPWAIGGIPLKPLSGRRRSHSVDLLTAKPLDLLAAVVE